MFGKAQLAIQAITTNHSQRTLTYIIRRSDRCLEKTTKTKTEWFLKRGRLLELPVIGGYERDGSMWVLPRFGCTGSWVSARSRSVRQRSSSSRNFSTRTSFTGWPDPTIFNVNAGAPPPPPPPDGLSRCSWSKAAADATHSDNPRTSSTRFSQNCTALRGSKPA